MGKNCWNAGTGYRYNEKPLGTQGVKQVMRELSFSFY
jgi:hypothetical protein